jgi:hypothetical protein
MKLHVYLYDPEGKCLFQDGCEFIPLAGGDFTEVYYKRRIITELLKYWEKDIADTWHNTSFVKFFEIMGLVPEGKYKCWLDIHFFFRRKLFLEFFEKLTPELTDSLYSALQTYDNIFVIKEDDPLFEQFKLKYGTCYGACDGYVCKRCETLTHSNSNYYENDDAYKGQTLEDAERETQCTCK